MAICRGKASTATTTFARSRLPRSLLIAHSAAAGAGFVEVSDGGFARKEIVCTENLELTKLSFHPICGYLFFE
jgi:hypothetical protein